MRILVFLIALLSISARAETMAHPYFFKLEKDGKASYLLGTIHMGVGAKELPEIILQALETSPLFASELNNETAARLAPGSSPIPQTFPADVKARLRQRGLPGNLIAFASPQVLCDYYQYWEGIEEGKNLDMELEELALAKGKARLELDEVELSRKLVRETIGQCHIEELVRSLSPQDAKLGYEKWVHESLGAYKLGAMESSTPSAADDAAYQIGARNAAWIVKLKAAHEQGAFINVGYQHLGGEHGLLELLKAEGFSVRRLNVNQTVPKGSP
ncbi:MAG TPA: TraB/GumN family protein [Bdellovibrionota bacterium]